MADRKKDNRDLEDKIADFKDNVVKGTKSLFSFKTRRQKVTKLGLAAVFAAVALPIGVQNMTEQELSYTRVADKQVITETQSVVTKELFRLEEMRDQLRDGKVVGQAPEVVEESRQLSRDFNENTRHILELGDGNRYEVRPTLGGLSKGEMEELWEDVKPGSYYTFTTARTITGDRVVTGYQKRSSYWYDY